MPSLKYAQIDRARCAACGACAKACPKNAAFVQKGCHAAVNAAACIGCGLCAKACPAGCIALKTRGDS